MVFHDAKKKNYTIINFPKIYYNRIIKNLLIEFLMCEYLRFWRFLKNCCKVVKLKDEIIKHRLNPILSIKTLVKHQLRVVCIMGGLTNVFLSTRQKFESEIN